MYLFKVIYCAFMSLQALPYFLDFESVWQELDVSESPCSIHGAFISRDVIVYAASERVRLVGLREIWVTVVSMDILVHVRLDVSENFIVTLPADGLSSVQVQTVRLTRNAVRHISSAAFRGLVSVTQLDLSHNQISYLSCLTIKYLTCRQVCSHRWHTCARSIYGITGSPTSVPRSSSHCPTCTS